MILEKKYFLNEYATSADGRRPCISLGFPSSPLLPQIIEITSVYTSPPPNPFYEITLNMLSCLFHFSWKSLASFKNNYLHPYDRNNICIYITPSELFLWNYTEHIIVVLVSSFMIKSKVSKNNFPHSYDRNNVCIYISLQTSFMKLHWICRCRHYFIFNRVIKSFFLFFVFPFQLVESTLVPTKSQPNNTMTKVISKKRIQLPYWTAQKSTIYKYTP